MVDSVVITVEEELTVTAVDSETITEVEDVVLRATEVGSVAPDKEELKLKVITNFEVTTEEQASTEKELQLWTTAGLEAMTDEVEADLEVTTKVNCVAFIQLRRSENTVQKILAHKIVYLQSIGPIMLQMTYIVAVYDN